MPRQLWCVPVFWYSGIIMAKSTFQGPQGCERHIACMQAPLWATSSAGASTACVGCAIAAIVLPVLRQKRIMRWTTGLQSRCHWSSPLLGLATFASSRSRASADPTTEASSYRRTGFCRRLLRDSAHQIGYLSSLEKVSRPSLRRTQRQCQLCSRQLCASRAGRCVPGHGS